MKVHFTGRHVELTQALKTLAQERLDKMASFLDDIIDVHVILSVEKHRHEAEVTLKTRSSSFVASSESMDMYKSLSEAMDKIEAQAHKQLQKKGDKNHVNGKQAILATEAES